MFFPGDIVRVIGGHPSNRNKTALVREISHTEAPHLVKIMFEDFGTNLYNMTSLELETDPDRLNKWTVLVCSL